MKLVLLLSLVSLCLSAPSVLPYWVVDPARYVAPPSDDYISTAICTIRLINAGQGLLDSIFANLTVSGGQTLESDLTGTYNPVGSFASLGRCLTAADGDQDLNSGNFTVVDASQLAPSGMVAVQQSPWVFVYYTSIVGNTLVGVTYSRTVIPTRASPASPDVADGSLVQGTCNDGGPYNATDIIFRDDGETVFGPNLIDQEWTAPQQAVRPPNDLIALQVAIPGDGIQRLAGTLAFTINSQVGSDVPVCCGCCSPTSCPCPIWRQPQNVTGPICNYQAWLDSAGYACSACDINLVKEWRYCTLEGELKYGARFVAVNPFGRTYELDAGTYTVSEPSASCNATCGEPTPSCFPNGRK